MVSLCKRLVKIIDNRCSRSHLGERDSCNDLRKQAVKRYRLNSENANQARPRHKGQRDRNDLCHQGKFEISNAFLGSSHNSLHHHIQ